ncbi:hypothetical protein Slu03_06030 [Sediminihabitans luteus]|nr:hypothetical protein Slu03_06030 [Sediminihabitans luteus]
MPGSGGQQLASSSSPDANSSHKGSEPEAAIERFIARAGLTRTEEIGVDGTSARRRVIAHDDRPLVGGTWYLVDFTHLDRLTYREVERALRSAPDGYQRVAAFVSDLSEDLEDHLRSRGVTVVRRADLDLPSATAAAPGMAASARPVAPPALPQAPALPPVPQVKHPPPSPPGHAPLPGARDGEPVVGAPQKSLVDLQYMCARLGVVLAEPDQGWPGHGKAVYLRGGGTAYLNPSNIDVRASSQQVALWARAGHGMVRGTQGQYLRLMLDRSRMPRAIPATVPALVDFVSAPVRPVEAPSVEAHVLSPRLGAPIPWIEQLFETALYAEQKAIAGRAAAPDKVVRDVLTVLVHRGMSGPIEAVEADAGLAPGDLRRQIPLMRRLLNLDGYDTLEFADGILELDDELLRQQFGLSRAISHEGVAR